MKRTKNFFRRIAILDDEGLLREEPIGAFTIGNYPQVLSGNGLIIGNDDRGASQDCKATLEEVKKAVKFVPVELLKGIPLKHNVIPLKDDELKEYMKSGSLPIGKKPTNPN
jgi:hypothetical protein